MKREYRVETINVGTLNRCEKIQEQLNKLGPESWEAVASVSYEGNTVGLILKRPISK